MGIAALVPRETKLLTEPLTTIEQSGVFEGYASLFGIADLGKDVVVPGAFADSLAKRGVAQHPAAVAARSRRSRSGAGSPSRRIAGACGCAASSTSRSSVRAISMR